MKGIVTVCVWVECPACGTEFDALELDQQQYAHELGVGRALFGETTQPAVWTACDVTVPCPSCGEDVLIEELTT
jgi:endogenous inhibitor of DNA gyrase (YacG/DUF329 family)